MAKVLAFWVVAAFKIAAIANRKGLGFGHWLTLSLLFSPILAALLLIAEPPNEEQAAIRSGEAYESGSLKIS